MVNIREKYVAEYYGRNYESVLREGFDKEMKVHGYFLATQARGKTLDFGCGPAMHFNALFMINASTIDGIDAVPENITFTRQKIASFDPEDYRVIERFMRKYDRAYSLKKQIQKIKNLIVADFTKLPKTLKKGTYDTIVSTYSISCVRTEREHYEALKNAFELLKPNGKFLALNTDGSNRNRIIPQMTYQGLAQGLALLHTHAKKIGFHTIRSRKIRIMQSDDAMYKYSNLLLTTAKR